MEHRFLGEICCPKQWKTISTSELTETGYPVYGANGIIGKYKEYNHEKATILVTCRGATCGSVVISKPYSYVNGNAMALDNLDDDICIDYLYFYLIGRGFADVISGSAQPQIIRSTIEKIRIPLYNFEKQKQIASVFSTINGMKLKFELLIEKYDQLVKARFVEMFGDPVINSMRWPEVLIGDNCFVTKLAGFEYTQYINYEDSGDVVMVKAQNVKNGKLNRKELSFISKKVSDSLPRSQLEPGDVVMTYVGANIGDVAVIDNEYKYHLAPNVAKIRPDAEVYDSIYFAYMLLFLNSYIVKNSADTAKAALGMDRIRKLHVFVPPIDIQRKFSEFIKQIDKSKLAVQQSLEKTQLLFDSLMQEYFGEN